MKFGTASLRVVVGALWLVAFAVSSSGSTARCQGMASRHACSCSRKAHAATGGGSCCMRMAQGQPEAVMGTPAARPAAPLAVSCPAPQLVSLSMAAELQVPVETSPDPPPLHQATTPLLI